MKKRAIFRYLIPVILIFIWFAIAGVGGPTFGKISNVSKNDQSSFLPASAESTKAQTLQKKFYNSNTIPATIVIESPHKIPPDELSRFSSLSQSLRGVSGVSDTTTSVVGPIPSRDKRAIEFIVQINQSSNVGSAVKQLRAKIKQSVDSSYRTYVTGPAGLTADLVAAFGGIDGILLVVALVAVFVILILVYRSILLPFIVLLSAMFALSGAILLIYQLALHGLIVLNGQSQGILSILVIGAATDYSLLFIARFRESLHHVESKWEATAHAYRGAFAPITASAMTVIVALLCLLFSDLNSNKSLGPVAAIGIALAYIVAMTLLPSLLALLGRAAFWPVVPRYTKQSAKKLDTPTKLWATVGNLVEHHSRRVWVICTILLLVCVVGITQLKANGTTQAATLLSPSNAVDGQAVLAHYFSAGSGSPATVIVPEHDMRLAKNILNHTHGIGQVSVFTGGAPFEHLPPKIVDGKVLLNATLSSAADSSAAEHTIVALRSKLKDNSVNGLIGGETAINLDSNKAATHDLYTILPIVLVVILFILMILLRSIVSAAILIGTVILSFLATLGVSAMVFNHVFHFPGADPSVPLYGFIFLVALGVDYNIFLMTRVREETEHHDTRQAIIRGLQVTGGVITSAGVVLASTFAALGVIPILFLAQIAFIVAFGVLLDTIVVRSLLLSSLTYDIGGKIWWPSKLSRKDRS